MTVKGEKERERKIQSNNIFYIRNKITVIQLSHINYQYIIDNNYKVDL